MSITRNIKYDIDEMLLNEGSGSGIMSIFMIIESIASLFRIVLTGGLISSLWNKEGFSTGGYVGLTVVFSLLAFILYWFLKGNNDTTDLKHTSDILPNFKIFITAVMGLSKTIEASPKGKDFIANIEKSTFDTLLEVQKIRKDTTLDKATRDIKVLSLVRAEYNNIDKQIMSMKNKVTFDDNQLGIYTASKESLDNLIKSKLKS